MLVSRCWFLDAGFSMLVSRYWFLDAGSWILVSGCWFLDTGFSMRKMIRHPASCFPHPVSDISHQLADG